ncbi:MAG: transketolase C-terminal domain-containing protein [Patescibacteria group bacterium]
MLNQNSKKLNKNLFDKDVEQMPIRFGFGEGLVIAAENDKNVVGLCADLTESTRMHLFKQKFPERFIEMGIGEQSMASVASGMAAMGKIPFISSYAMFSPGRNWEQIRTTICYNNRNVKIAGSHAGISVGQDGGTHQAIEDIAITRVIPRLTVISPCDSIEAKKATIAAAKMIGPVYIRLAREKTPIITTDETPFEIGKAQIFWQPENKDEKPVAAIVATGALVHKALVVAKELEAEGIQMIVVNLSTIKPFDEKTIFEVAKRTGKVVTVEEHQAKGGMGSAVAEFLSQNYPVPMKIIGVDDQFGQSGTPDELLEHYGLSVANIKKAVLELVE